MITPEPLPRPARTCTTLGRIARAAASVLPAAAAPPASGARRSWTIAVGDADQYWSAADHAGPGRPAGQHAPGRGRRRAATRRRAGGAAAGRHRRRRGGAGGVGRRRRPAGAGGAGGPAQRMSGSGRSCPARGRRRRPCRGVLSYVRVRVRSDEPGEPAQREGAGPDGDQQAEGRQVRASPRAARRASRSRSRCRRRRRAAARRSRRCRRCRRSPRPARARVSPSTGTWRVRPSVCDDAVRRAVGDRRDGQSARGGRGGRLLGRAAGGVGAVGQHHDPGGDGLALGLRGDPLHLVQRAEHRLTDGGAAARQVEVADLPLHLVVVGGRRGEHAAGAGEGHHADVDRVGQILDEGDRGRLGRLEPGRRRRRWPPSSRRCRSRPSPWPGRRAPAAASSGRAAARPSAVSATSTRVAGTCRRQPGRRGTTRSSIGRLANRTAYRCRRRCTTT